MSRRQDFADKVIVITGAGSGIGRSLAQQFDAAGARLALGDINAAGLAETAATLHGRVLTQVFDVADRAAFEAFAMKVEQSCEAVGIVINNAGVDVSQDVANTSYADFEWLFGINFWGVVHGTKAFLPRMLERDRGVIVNVSSVFGFVAWPMHSAYVASKFAVRGFTETLRHELAGSGVRAVPVHPGGIRTNIVRNSRFHVDDAGSADRERITQEFDQIAMTSPDKAAATIIDGIARGKRRILIGLDARIMERLTRWLPTRYWGVIAAAVNSYRKPSAADKRSAQTPEKKRAA